MPASRKAPFSDSYLQHVESIRAGAQGDFRTPFGDAFVAAYDEQLLSAIAVWVGNPAEITRMRPVPANPARAACESACACPPWQT